MCYGVVNKYEQFIIVINVIVIKFRIVKSVLGANKFDFVIITNIMLS